MASKVTSLEEGGGQDGEGHRTRPVSAPLQVGLLRAWEEGGGAWQPGLLPPEGRSEGLNDPHSDRRSRDITVAKVNMGCEAASFAGSRQIKGTSFFKIYFY